MTRRWPPHEYELAKQWREIGMTYRTPYVKPQWFSNVTNGR